MVENEAERADKDTKGNKSAFLIDFCLHDSQKTC